MDHFIESFCVAGYVLILGYSLPESDSQARSKITVASQVNANCDARMIGSGMVSVVSRVKELRRRARDSPVRFQRSEPRGSAHKASVEIC